MRPLFALSVEAAKTSTQTSPYLKIINVQEDLHVVIRKMMEQINNLTKQQLSSRFHGVEKKDQGALDPTDLAIHSQIAGQFLADLGHRIGEEHKIRITRSCQF